MQALLLLDAYSINNNLSKHESKSFHLENYSLSEFIRHLYVLVHLNLPMGRKCLKTHTKYVVSNDVVCSFVLLMWNKCLLT